MYSLGILNDFEDIRSKVRAGGYTNNEIPPQTRKYPANHVFDRNKSVVWNEEEVARQNRKIAAARGAHQRKSNQLHDDFRRDVVAAIVEDTGITEAQARVVFSRAYERGHSDGMEEVVNHAISLGGFALDIISASDGV